jgi:hypothetical protein
MLRACVAFLLLMNAFGVAAAQTAPAGQSEPKSAAPKQAPAKKPAAKPAAPKQAAAPAAAGKCVGVVSRLGDTLNVKKIGIIVFQNEDKETPIESWRVDDLIVARVGSFLGGRATARRITYPKGAFASLDEIKLFRNYNADLGAILRTLVGGTRCVRYVVVSPMTVQWVNTNQNLKGLGILDWAAIVDQYWIHVLATLVVYDGETFAVLDSKAATIGQSIFFADVRGPHRKVDESYWPGSGDAAQHAKLRDGIRDLVAQSIDKTLPELKLME